MCDLWDDPERRKYLESTGNPEPNWSMCDCGEKVHISDHPVCKGVGKFGGHLPTVEYRPFVPFYDRGLGKHIRSLAEWNRAMHEGGWDLRSKYDREEKPPTPSSKGVDRAFNDAVRQRYGGVLPVGNFLSED